MADTDSKLKRVTSDQVLDLLEIMGKIRNQLRLTSDSHKDKLKLAEELVEEVAKDMCLHEKQLSRKKS